MTAETLKPFITPTSVENYVTTQSSVAASTDRRRSCYFLAITASVITVILTATFLGITIWNTMRITNLQTEVKSLNRVIESMQKRLGLTYLDDLNDLEKEAENNNTLIDDVLPDADVDDSDNDHENMSEDDEEEDEDDDDDDYEDYEELMNKFRHYQETEEDEEETDSVDSLGDDNLYDDFEKFNNSKRKRHGERQARSVIALNTENENIDELSDSERSIILRTLKESRPQSIVANENFEKRRSPLRIRHSRRRKLPLVKSGDFLISAKSVAPVTSKPIEVKPAAHFHISHTIPYHKHRLQISNHNGDVYIGKPSVTNEMNVDNYFHVEHGVITVREPGLYYVYAQICYNNNFPKNGFTIFHNDKEFLQCLHNSHHPNNISLINTCHTSGLIYLRHNEQIHIRDFHANRMTFLSDKSDRSYFGLIKI